MTTAQISPNPFALMMDPETVLAAVARSDRLNRLTSRICRPLDKPLPGRPAEADTAAGSREDDESDSNPGGDQCAD